MLFIYGTLLSKVEHPSHKMIQDNCRFISAATINGRLYDVGDFPALVRCAKDGNDKGRVLGELYEIINEDKLFYHLDYYEGCSPEQSEPHLYKREKVVTTLTDKSAQNAWTYFFNREIHHLTWITSGDYVHYLKNKK